MSSDLPAFEYVVKIEGGISHLPLDRQIQPGPSRSNPGTSRSGCYLNLRRGKGERWLPARTVKNIEPVSSFPLSRLLARRTPQLVLVRYNRFLQGEGCRVLLHRIRLSLSRTDDGSSFWKRELRGWVP